MFKVVLTGPESCGKTTLAQALAREFKAPWVPEQARAWLEERDGKYEESDLLLIAKAQVQAEEREAAKADDLLICDTDLITIRVWSDFKYGRCNHWIEEKTESREYDLWLLCRPDIPWEGDAFRENEEERDELFDLHEEVLMDLGKPYAYIDGEGEERIVNAIRAVRDLLSEVGE